MLTYTPPLIEIRDLSVVREHRDILRDVNLTIHRGDFVAITGPNGGGKTTLLRVILGLMKPTSGEVIIDRNLPIGYLPQKNMIDSHFPITVREVVESGLLGIKCDDAPQRVDQALEMVKMTEHAHRAIGMLSGGQLQRALLARAIISRPQLLVLDEPLSYIDKHFEKHLYTMIAEIAKNTTIVLVSHEMTTIAAMANRHLIIDCNLTECTAEHHYVSSC